MGEDFFIEAVASLSCSLLSSSRCFTSSLAFLSARTRFDRLDSPGRYRLISVGCFRSYQTLALASSSFNL